LVRGSFPHTSSSFIFIRRRYFLLQFVNLMRRRRYFLLWFVSVMRRKYFLLWCVSLNWTLIWFNTIALPT